MMSLTATRIAAALGAEIEGIDLRAINSDCEREIRSLLTEFQVLVFPGQSLAPEDLVRFARCFGNPRQHPVVPHIEGYPEVIEIRNFGKGVTLNEHWHSDVTFEERPPMVTLLHALEVPEVGGDTQFSDQYQAWETLSDGLKRMLTPLRALHSGDLLARAMGRSEAPHALHPVARTHPDTGSKALYVCQAFTRHFEDTSAEESRPLLQYLYEHAARPEFTARHQWKVGDLVIWDNRCVQHYAIHDHGDAARVLHRVTVEGERPI
jgi:taurine dioxygenase